MAFTKKTWVDKGQTGSTPLNATNLNDLEDRISNATAPINDLMDYTKEQQIGIWKDGKKLYRQVFEFSNYNTEYRLDITNLSEVINVEAYFRRKDYTNMSQKVPSRLSSDFQLSFKSIVKEGSTVTVSFENGSAWANAFLKAIIILEYTKTI